MPFFVMVTNISVYVHHPFQKLRSNSYNLIKQEMHEIKYTYKLQISHVWMSIHVT